MSESSIESCKKVICPRSIVDAFIEASKENTKNNMELGGYIFGKADTNDNYICDYLLIPD
jgi:hypothetical protein